MQVTTEQIDPCKIALTISVEPEKVAEATEKAYQQAAKTVAVPGFRKGKVPPAMARQYLDEGKVRQRAAEMLIDPAYAAAVAQTSVEPFAQPELELVSMNPSEPFVFKALVPLRPVVTLGLYKGLAINRTDITVTDEDIEKEIEALRGRQAEYPEVEGRTAQIGDVLLADLTAEIEGRDTGELSTPHGTLIEIGKNIPDFDNGLVGLAAGDEKTIEAIYPDTFADESLRGKRATFTVAVKELRAKVLPELTDEFVSKAHPTAKNEAELRSAIREGLESTAKEMADNDVEFQIVSKIVQTSQIFFPDVLLRAEMSEDIRQINERLKEEKATIEQYLEAVGKSAQEVEQEIAQGAAQRIQNSLVLSEVARQEEITIEDADVDRVIEERAVQAKVSAAAVRLYAEKNNQLGQYRDQALTEKILTFLKDASSITARAVTAAELRTEQEAAAAAVPAFAEATTETAEAAEPLATEAAKPKRRTKKVAAEVTDDASTSE